jgi:hypothetical protein
MSKLLLVMFYLEKNFVISIKLIGTYAISVIGWSKIKFNKVNAVPSETPSAPSQPELSTGGSKRFGKKLYVVAAIVAVAVIAVALLIPQGTAIPLNVDYEVGEKMVYDTTMTLTVADFDSALPSTATGALNDTSVNAKQTIEVIDFDGEYYTLNQTTTIMMGGKPFSISMLQKMDKTGCSTYLFSVGGTEQEVPDTSLTSSSYLAQLLNKSEVKVGDRVNVPFPSTLSGMGVTGDLTMTFRGIEDLTVPAGTYKVFRIDITSNDLSISYNPSMTTGGMNLSTKMDMDLNHQMYMEYGTLRQIKSTTLETVSLQSSMMNYTVTLSMDMTLNEHIKP